MKVWLGVSRHVGQLARLVLPFAYLRPSENIDSFREFFIEMPGTEL